MSIKSMLEPILLLASQFRLYLCSYVYGKSKLRDAIVTSRNA